MGFRTFRIIFVSALFLSVLTVSCKKEPFLTREGVAFSMSNKGADTKATYGSFDKDNKLQMIDWTAGDEISICCYCPDAESPVSKTQGPVKYNVASVSTDANNQSVATVGVVSDESSIKWGGDHNHKFYCVYPAAGDGAVTTSFGFENNNCVVKGTIPETQPQQEELKPYMLMYGKAESQPEPKVDVDFYPLTTCVDFTIKFEVPMKVTNIALISSDGNNLSGDFSYNFDSGVCTSIGTNKKVMVSYGAGQACTTDTELNFKLFVNPSADIVEPYFAVNYIDTEGVSRYTKTQLKYKDGVSGGPFKFVKSHKTNVTGIIVKEGFIITSFGEPTLAPWIEGEETLTVGDEYEYFLEVVNNSDKTLTFDDEGDGLTQTLQVKSYMQAKDGTKTAIKPSLEFPASSFVGTVPNITLSNSAECIYTIDFVAQQNSPSVETVDISSSLKNAVSVTNHDLSSGGTTANCYVVSAPGTYKFKIAYGNGVGYNNQYNGTPAGSTVSVLWQTSDNLINSPNVSEGYVTFTVLKDNIKQGNALIALNNGNTITWSWHIWFTDATTITSVPLGYYTTGTRTVTTYSKRTMEITVSNPYDPLGSLEETIKLEQGRDETVNSEDVTSRGCTYYQWGRKDPFLVGKYTAADSASGYSLDDSIKNPTIMSKATGYDNDWTHTGSGTHYGDLWGTTQTVFDPCPYGYHVPASYESIELKNCGYINGSHIFVADDVKYWTYTSDSGAWGASATAKDNNSQSVIKCWALCVMPVK